MKRILMTGALIALLGFTGLYFAEKQGIDVGVELPGAPALFETSLAAPITSSATSFTLTANSVRGGGSISGYHCFTIDEGSAQAEFACGTVSGTAVTSVTRGISPADGITSDADVKFSHRRGASVVISDFPIIQLLRAQNNGEQTFQNALSYASSVVPSSADHLADVGYVLSVVTGGAVSFDKMIVTGTAGETLVAGNLIYFKASDQRWWKVDTDTASTYQNVAVGIAQGSGTAGASIGTGVLLQGLDGTQTGMTAGSTYYASTAAGAINTTVTSLKLGYARTTTSLYFQPEQVLTAMNNTWSGSNVFTGSVFGIGSSTVTVYTADSSWTKPAKFTHIQVWTCGGGGGGGGNTSTDGDAAGGGGGGCGFEDLTPIELSATTSVQVKIGAGGTAGPGTGGTGGTGGTSNFGTFLSATGGAGGTLGGNGGAGGVGSGADLNLNGNGGGGAGSGASGISSGFGGGSFFGGGAPGVTTASASNGINGTAYGGGGSGAAHSGANANDASGGTGAAGVIMVIEFY